MQYTEKQRRAIETASGTVLVSAAAGSGKTSVLARRVARLVEQGADVREMLVMTFTNAAAAEMRLRIAKELYSASVTAQDRRLVEQSELAGAADICTFHSFCAKTVRENYLHADVSPDFRILAEDEAASLRMNTLREFFDLLYEQQDAGFLRLLTRFTTRAEDRQLMQMLLRVYEGMLGQPQPYDWALQSVAMPQEVYIAGLKEVYAEMLLGKLQDALALMQLACTVAEEYSEAQALADTVAIETLEDMLACAQGTDIVEAMECFGEFKIPAIVRGADPAIREISGEWRTTARKNLKEFLEDTVYCTFEAEVSQQLEHTQQDVQEMVRLIRIFDKMYAAQKKERNALDYEDLQHKALEALRQNGAQYQQKYAYLFVDEYQDTNPVQDEIINLIHHSGNKLFMVGDIKQSIYRFRQADPGIFRRKAQNFRQTEDGGEMIVMNDNFRSAGSVIDAVNFVMGCVMSERLGEVTYCEEEELSKTAEGGDVRVLLCTVNEEEDEEESVSAHMAQAEMIAQSIAQVLRDGVTDSRTAKPRQIGYGDIAVLMRSRSELTGEIKRALDVRGIPCVISMKQVRDIPEAELFINLLRVIENPMQDVPLLCVLRSYIGNFDEEDFAAIRLTYNDKRPFHMAATQYAEENENALGRKLQAFFEELETRAQQCRALPLMDFIRSLVEEYDFYVYLMSVRGGNSKRVIFEELLALMGTLVELSGNSLYGLLRELAEIKKRDGGYVQSSESARQADCVQIMTIHGSKGLEFPVVYLAGMNKRFNMKDSNESFLLHSEYGVSASYVDEISREKYETVERSILRYRIACENRSEELRMLYVAMTRAKECLYITGYVKDKERQFEKWGALSGRYDKASCMLDWVMAANMQGKAIEVEVNTVLPTGEQTKIFDFDQWKQSMLEEKHPLELISLPQTERIPAKVSVSAVKRSQQPGIRSFLQPQKVEEEEITGAQLGTLVHGMMEHIVKNGGAFEAEAQRLLEANLVSPKEYEALLKNRAMVEGFLQSELYTRVKNATRVLFEQPFNMRIPAKEIGYDSAETMLVQGIIDLAFLEQGKWVLLDYKTDRVEEQGIKKAAAGYAVQLDLYARALTQITGIPVIEKYLYFMRPGIQVLLD